MDESFILLFVVLEFITLCLLYTIGKIDGYEKAIRELRGHSRAEGNEVDVGDIEHERVSHAD